MLIKQLFLCISVDRYLRSERKKLINRNYPKPVDKKTVLLLQGR